MMPSEVKEKIVAQVTLREASRRLGMSEQSLGRIVNGWTPITPRMAAKLERAFGLDAGDIAANSARVEAERLAAMSEDLWESRQKAKVQIR
jgi:plasmid maintenance system antidote protein VapI